MGTKTAPACPVAGCVVFLEMAALPGDSIISSRMLDPAGPAKTKRGDWTGGLVRQPCGHTLTAEQQTEWLTAYQGGAE